MKPITTETPKRQKKILIVDDEGDLTEILLLRLEKNGFLVDVALDGKAGIAKARDFMPDVILLDVVMPEMSGWDVYRALRIDPATKNIPVVIMTALQPLETQEQAASLGIEFFLLKPFESSELTELLKKTLEGIAR